MAVVRRSEAAGGGHRLIEVLNDAGAVVPVAGDFLAYLSARGCSPNTVLACDSDLGHLWRFLDAARLGWDAPTPERAIDLLAHLRATPARHRGQSRLPMLATHDGVSADPPGLSPATVNRALAAVSSFYDWAILAPTWTWTWACSRDRDGDPARPSGPPCATPVEDAARRPGIVQAGAGKQPQPNRETGHDAHGTWQASSTARWA